MTAILLRDYRMRFIVAGGLVFFTFLVVAARSEACGALVTREASLVVQAQQRVLISLRSDDTSHIVIELAIPSADAPFGALTPVGAEPTIDSAPIDVGEMDGLELSTRPTVEVEEPKSGMGCGCGSDAAGGDKSGGSRGGVNVVQTVDVGPVTAVVLSADSTAPLTQWLGDNGFVIPPGQQALVDAYVGPGKFFIAFKRSSQAPVGASSVGVSFSVAGDMRGYPLGMSRIGSGSRLAIQVFVAAPAGIAPNGSAPSSPFTALLLTDLNAARLASDYAGAVFEGVRARSSKAFVIEGVFRTDESWRNGLGPTLARLTEPGQVLTRLATVVSPDTLDRDVSFLAPAPAQVPRRVVASMSSLAGPGLGGRSQPLTLAILGACVAAGTFRRASGRGRVRSQLAPRGHLG